MTDLYKVRFTWDIIVWNPETNKKVTVTTKSLNIDSFFLWFIQFFKESFYKKCKEPIKTKVCEWEETQPDNK